jgi:hypothetical protein
MCQAQPRVRQQWTKNIPSDWDPAIFAGSRQNSPHRKIDHPVK